MVTHDAIGTVKGIEIQKIPIESEGELDLHGFLALDEKTDPGSHDLPCQVTFAAKASDEALKKFTKPSDGSLRTSSTGPGRSDGTIRWRPPDTTMEKPPPGAFSSPPSPVSKTRAGSQANSLF
jgi:hypothetical protein